MNKIYNIFKVVLLMVLVAVTFKSDSLNNQILAIILLIVFNPFLELFIKKEYSKNIIDKIFELLFYGYLIFTIYRVLFDPQLNSSEGYNFYEMYFQYRLMVLVVIALVFRIYKFLSQSKIDIEKNNILNYLLVFNVAIATNSILTLYPNQGNVLNSFIPINPIYGLLIIIMLLIFIKMDNSKLLIGLIIILSILFSAYINLLLVFLLYPMIKKLSK